MLPGKGRPCVQGSLDIGGQMVYPYPKTPRRGERPWLMDTFPFCKLEIFVPPSHLEAVAEALAQADAGHIG